MSVSRHIVHRKQPVHLFSLVYGDNDNKDGTMSFFCARTWIQQVVFFVMGTSMRTRKNFRLQLSAYEKGGTKNCRLDREREKKKDMPNVPFFFFILSLECMCPVFWYLDSFRVYKQNSFNLRSVGRGNDFVYKFTSNFFVGYVSIRNMTITCWPVLREHQFLGVK